MSTNGITSTKSKPQTAVLGGAALFSAASKTLFSAPALELAEKVTNACGTVEERRFSAA
jgi:hypothetical protein